MATDGGPGGRPGNAPLAARRRLSRELALQLLFQRDLSGGADDEQPGLFQEGFEPDRDEELSLGVGQEAFEAAWPQAVELYLGVSRVRGRLDGDIARAAVNWRMDRMSPVDRALIRLAYFEMLYRPEVPVKTCLNEAVELAKGFGNSDSQAFVNGVLDRLARTLGDRSPAPGSGSPPGAASDAAVRETAPGKGPAAGIPETGLQEGEPSEIQSGEVPREAADGASREAADGASRGAHAGGAPCECIDEASREAADEASRGAIDEASREATDEVAGDGSEDGDGA
ncbi:MAG: transcription antitermination factor NusB [Deltaproteobacteria bacterium]|jgi:N utilization substance protein B|nr:transcription antitermination factor NusB [Deltaproteobacteria bacterium]